MRIGGPLGVLVRTCISAQLFLSICVCMCLDVDQWSEILSCKFQKTGALAPILSILFFFYIQIYDAKSHKKRDVHSIAE